MYEVTHSPGGVVIFGSHSVNASRQYACACGMWKGSSLRWPATHETLRRITSTKRNVPCKVHRRWCSPPSAPRRILRKILGTTTTSLLLSPERGSASERGLSVRRVRAILVSIFGLEAARDLGSLQSPKGFEL